MNVIALLGSPRKGGNTDILADAVLEGAREAGAQVAKVCLDDLRIRPIAEVGDVRAAREDTRSDDDFPAVLDRFLDAQVVVFATPVYWAGVSAQLKCFMDRASAYFGRPGYAERFQGKGYVVVTAYGSPEPDHGKWVTEPMKTCVEFLGGQYLGDLAVRAYKKGEVAEMADALDAARRLGAGAVSKMAQG